MDDRRGGRVQGRDPASGESFARQLELEAGVVVRDMRTNERFWLHDTILDDYAPFIGADGFAIYSSLSCMANRDQYCWPSIGRLAQHWGKGRTTVVRAITLLDDLRLIHVRRERREDGGQANNTYYLLEPLPIAAAMGSLAQALRARGHSIEAAVSLVLGLLPQHWEPLRRKQPESPTRQDWERTLRRLLAEPDPAPPGGITLHDGGSPVMGLGGAATGLARSERVPGGAVPGLGVSHSDRGAVPAQTQPSPDRLLASSSPESGVVPAQDPKDRSHQGLPINQPQKPHHHQGAVGGVLTHDAQIRGYDLDEDAVFVEDPNGDALPIQLAALVQRDLIATHDNFGVRISTPCFYSARQFLEDVDDWTADERRKATYHRALWTELEQLYREIGACSLQEALATFFTADLVAQYTRGDADTLARIRSWLRYLRGPAGEGVANPAGFLRSKIESDQWAPQTREGRRAPR